jgi:hypothetical protein
MKILVNPHFRLAVTETGDGFAATKAQLHLTRSKNRLQASWGVYLTARGHVNRRSWGILPLETP